MSWQRGFGVDFMRSGNFLSPNLVASVKFVHADAPQNEAEANCYRGCCEVCPHSLPAGTELTSWHCENFAQGNIAKWYTTCDTWESDAYNDQGKDSRVN